MAKFEITWEAPEFEYREKEVSWYWLSIIIASIIIAFSVWEKNFLFGFFVVIAEILFIIWGNRVPKVIRFQLTDEGIEIENDKLYPLKGFESWSVDGTSEELVDIAFYFRSRIRPPLIVIAPKETLTEIRADLKTLLKEIEHDMSLIDSIEKFLRF